MKDSFTRRTFIRTAAAGSVALGWLGARQAPRAYAAEAARTARPLEPAPASTGRAARTVDRDVSRPAPAAEVQLAGAAILCWTDRPGSWNLSHNRV